VSMRRGSMASKQTAQAMPAACQTMLGLGASCQLQLPFEAILCQMRDSDVRPPPASILGSPSIQPMMEQHTLICCHPPPPPHTHTQLGVLLLGLYAVPQH
jgi:hypothetical protein